MKNQSMLSKLLRCAKAGFRFQGMSWDVTNQIANEHKAIIKELLDIFNATQTGNIGMNDFQRITELRKEYGE